MSMRSSRAAVSKSILMASSITESRFYKEQSSIQFLQIYTFTFDHPIVGIHPPFTFVRLRGLTPRPIRRQPHSKVLWALILSVEMDGCYDKNRLCRPIPIALECNMDVVTRSDGKRISNQRYFIASSAPE
jgi:hypothetical protein